MKPSVLIIVNRLVISGQSPDTLSLAWYLREDFDITILYGKKEPDEEDALYLLEKYPGLNVKKIDHLQRSFSVSTDLKAFIALFRFIKAARPNLVHTHGSKSGLLGRLAAKLAGVKAIVHTYHGHFFHSYYGKFTSRLVILVEKMLAKITTVCIVLSKSQFNEIVFKYKIVNEQKARLIPLGFNALQFSGTGVHASESFWQQYCLLPPGKIVVAIIGRIVPVKNHLKFLEAAELLLQTNDHLIFLIVGDGYLRKKLEAFLQQKNRRFQNLSYKEGVHFIFAGWQKNIDDILSAVDIVALSSLNEGTPMCLLEAQFAGKPVVAIDTGGVCDTMMDNETGFLCKTKDAHEMAEKINSLVHNSDLRKTMGEKGKQFVAAQFSKEKEIENIYNLYTSYTN